MRKGFVNCPALRRVGHSNPEGADVLGFKSGARLWAGGTKGKAGERQAGRSQRRGDKTRRQPDYTFLPTLAYHSPLPSLVVTFP